MEPSDRILFIDDDAPVRTAFKRSLRGHGFTIDLASGGEEAHVMLAETEYAVIATDYRMPKVNGLDLVHEMQNVQPDATYMLVSGECDLDLALEAVNEHQISYVICKPWDTEDLASVLKRSMEEYWERASQRQFQSSMVSASRNLEDQKAKLRGAMETAEEQLSQALLSTLEMRGHETRAHCKRVSRYCLMIAEQMGLQGRILRSIERGALLHDVGKIAIPDEILLKRGPLTADEWQQMRTHPQVGASLLEGFEGLKGARILVSQHHERWDGTGYPTGLSGESINIGARIFAVADALDAILGQRPYSDPITPELAIAEITRCSGSQFDPTVVAAFQHISIDAFLAVRAELPDEPLAVRAA